MKLCIAHGGDVSEPSGGTNRVVAFASGLADRGTEVTLVVPEPSAEIPTKLDSVNVREVDTGIGGVSNALTRAVSVSREALETAERTGSVLQFEHSTLGGIATLFGASGFVLDMHDLVYPRYDHVDSPVAPVLRHAVSRLERRAVERAAHVVTVSTRMNERIESRWDCESGRLSAVPNGYFEDTIDGISQTEPTSGRVGFIGTLHPKVDLQVFVELAELSSVSEMVVVGDGGQRGMLEELAKEQESLRITGRLPDGEAFRILSGSQVVVNPQVHSKLQQSSSPVKLFYYSALGKPMVVSEGPEVAHELASGDAAVVLDSDGDFVEAVERVLSDDQLRERLANNAEVTARSFHWGNRVEELAQVYRDISDDIGIDATTEVY